MQASEMMYVFSPTSQCWRKTLLWVKKGFMLLLLLHSSDEGLKLKTLAIHQTSQAKLTISTLIDQTHIQLTHQCRKKKLQFFQNEFFSDKLKCTTIQAFLQESGNKFDKFLPYRCSCALPQRVELFSSAEVGGERRPAEFRKLGGNAVLKTIRKYGRQIWHRLQKICW